MQYLKMAIMVCALFLLLAISLKLSDVNENLQEIVKKEAMIIEYQDLQVESQFLEIESVHTLIEAMQESEGTNIINIQ